MTANGSPRALILTPGTTGADGIAHVTRMVVRALGAVRPRLDVVSLADARAGAGPGAALVVPGARVFGASGGKARWGAAALRAAFAGPPPTEVVCLHLHLSTVGGVLAAARRSRFCVFLHGIEAWRRLTLIERRTLARADAIVANSLHTARRFREANPDLSALPIRVCPPGVEAPDPEPTGALETDAPEFAPFALIVGRMAAEERYKGHDLLLEIWPRVIAAVPAARLVVAGDGDDRARLESRAATLGDRVRFTGRVSGAQLEALYRRCAFFVMPSRGEGFGLVFLEAMRAGKACIGGVGAAAEIIVDGATGLVVDPERLAEVLDAVVRLFSEPETRERMGRAGALRVTRDFTEADFGRRLRAALGHGGSLA